MSDKSIVKLKSIIYYGEDNEVLTPCNFWIGRPLLDVIEPIQDNEKIGRL